MAISKYKMEHIKGGMQEKDTYRFLGIKPGRLREEKEQKDD
jgi:hypothetical protein